MGAKQLPRIFHPQIENHSKRKASVYNGNLKLSNYDIPAFLKVPYREEPSIRIPLIEYTRYAANGQVWATFKLIYADEFHYEQEMTLPVTLSFYMDLGRDGRGFVDGQLHNNALLTFLVTLCEQLKEHPPASVAQPDFDAELIYGYRGSRKKRFRWKHTSVCEQFFSAIDILFMESLYPIVCDQEHPSFVTCDWRIEPKSKT